MEKKYIYSDNCPADAIREYVEPLILKQEEYLLRGEPVPEELLIPSKIELSPENILFLINSKYVCYIGAGPTGYEINFYFEATEELSALEIRTVLAEDGRYYLTYIRKESTKDRLAFEWNVMEQDNKKGLLCVTKVEDDLEDLVDIPYKKKKV